MRKLHIAYCILIIGLLCGACSAARFPTLYVDAGEIWIADANITDANVAQWWDGYGKALTAYGWGDHGAVGYLTWEGDPCFTASEAANVGVADVNFGNFGITGAGAGEFRAGLTVGQGLTVGEEDTGSNYLILKGMSRPGISSLGSCIEWYSGNSTVAGYILGGEGMNRMIFTNAVDNHPEYDSVQNAYIDLVTGAAAFGGYDSDLTKHRFTVDAQGDVDCNSVTTVGDVNGANIYDANWNAAYAHIHNLTTDIDHDTLVNYEPNEHIDWTATDANLHTDGSIWVGLTGSFIYGLTVEDLIIGGSISGGGLNINNWDTAYDHSLTNHFSTADETDPCFADSEAANITATDITNLGNLSGTNTGDASGHSGLVPYSGASGGVDLGAQTFATTGEVKAGTLESSGTAAATGTRSLAWGEGAIASAEDSIALGGVNGTAKLGYYYTTASDLDTIAIGSGAWATETYAIGIGYRAVSSGLRSFAVGNKAAASSEDSIAVGKDSVASTGIGAVAVGYAAIASNTGALAIGNSNITASGVSAIAIGKGITNSTDSSVAIGVTNAAFTATATGAVLPLDTQLGDAPTDIITVNGAFKPRRLSQSTEPTPAAGEMMIWRDSDDGKVYFMYNDADSGVKKTEML